MQGRCLKWDAFADALYENEWRAARVLVAQQPYTLPEGSALRGTGS